MKKAVLTFNSLVYDRADIIRPSASPIGERWISASDGKTERGSPPFDKRRKRYEKNSFNIIIFRNIKRKFYC